MRWKVQRDGQRSKGVNEHIWQNPVCFDPFSPHATCKWTGTRYVITVHSSRAWAAADKQVRGDLRALGFPLPPVTLRPPQAMAVDGEVHDDDADGMWMVTKSLDAEIKKSCMLHAKEYVQSVNDIVQHLPRHASPQVSVLEVGSQHGHLQEILRQRGEMHEYMSDRGVDVSRSRDVATALQVLDDVKPHWLWLSPVCETEHPTGRSEEALIQCRRRWKQAAETCIALAQAQIDAGRHVVWEWPVETKFWSRGDVRAFMKRLKQSGQIFEARVHACQVEDRGSDDMPRSSRSWRLWSTSKSLAQVLHSVCDGGRQHQSLTCLLQRMPGNLPHATCRRVVQEMKLQFELQRAEDEQVCADHDRAFEVANQSFPTYVPSRSWVIRRS